MFLDIAWEIIACGALALVAVALQLAMPRQAPASCRVDGSCGCGPKAKEPGPRAAQA
jgi:hypothetical protein